MTRPFHSQRAPRPSLARHVERVWIERSTRSDPLLPDAAVELVWSGRGLFVRGADTHRHCIGSFPNQTFVALRFHPGSAARVIGLGGRDLADARVGVSVLWGRSEMERLESALAVATPTQAATLLEDEVERRVHEPPDPAVEAVVGLLDRQRVGIASLAGRIGLSERQLFRRCVAALGYGPKTLDRILRFQRFLAAARTSDVRLARLAADVGYADQPHLTRECMRLASATPTALLVRSRHDVRFVQDVSWAAL